MGRRSFMRVVKFGVQQGCLKIIHVPFGTACALVNCSDGDSGEVCAEMLRKEAAELSILETSQVPSTSFPETGGRRYVREAAVIYLQCPFDIEKYMTEAHINHGSRPDTIVPLATESQGDANFVLEEPLDEAEDDEKETIACAPFCKAKVHFYFG